MPVIPATWEAKAEELLESRRWKLQWAKIGPFYFSLGNRARLCLKRKKENTKKTKLLPGMVAHRCGGGHLKSQLLWEAKCIT